MKRAETRAWFRGFHRGWESAGWSWTKWGAALRGHVVAQGMARWQRSPEERAVRRLARSLRHMAERGYT